MEISDTRDPCAVASPPGTSPALDPLPGEAVRFHGPEVRLDEGEPIQEAEVALHVVQHCGRMVQRINMLAAGGKAAAGH